MEVCENFIQFFGPAKAIESFIQEFIVDSVYGKEISFFKISPVPDCLDAKQGQIWKETNWGLSFDPFNFHVFLDEIKQHGDYKYLSIRFDTKFLAPIPIYEKILNIYPTLSIQAFYCSEFGQCAGYFGHRTRIHYEGKEHVKKISRIGVDHFGWHTEQR